MNRKYMLPLVFLAVSLGCAIGVTGAAWWMNINPGQIASGVVQSYMGNAGHAFFSCAAESFEQRRFTFACFVSGVGVSVVLVVLVVVACGQASAREGLAQNPIQVIPPAELQQIVIQVLGGVENAVAVAVQNGFNQLQLQLQPQPVGVLNAAPAGP